MYERSCIVAVPETSCFRSHRHGWNRKLPVIGLGMIRCLGKNTVHAYPRPVILVPATRRLQHGADLRH